MKRVIDPALGGDLGEQRVEQREIGARVDGEMQHVVRPGFRLAGGDRRRAARIDEDDPGRCDRFGAELGLLLVGAGAAQVRHPMVQEVVGLRLQRVASHRHDRVGEFGIFVAVVQLADAHVARAVHFAVVGRAIVDADVLDLHALEIELAGRPGVFVAAAGAAMIVSRDDQAVLALRLDNAPRHLGDEIDRVVPGGRRQDAVAPDERFGQPLALRAGDGRIREFRDLGAARRAKAGIHATESGSGMTTRCTSRPFCLTMLYIDGLNQAVAIAPCCFVRSA